MMELEKAIERVRVIALTSSPADREALDRVAKIAGAVLARRRRQSQRRGERRAKERGE